MQRPCQDVMPRTLARQIKIADVKLKHMTSLTGLALRYFARDVKLTTAASGFLKPFSTCKLCLHQHYYHQTR